MITRYKLKHNAVCSSLASVLAPWLVSGLVAITVEFGFGQPSFFGIRSSLQGGIVAALSNPSETALMPHSLDLNLGLVEIGVRNSLLPIPIDRSLIEGISLRGGTLAMLNSLGGAGREAGMSFLSEALSNGTPMNFGLGIEAMGPGLAIAAGRSLGFGVFTRLRGSANIYNMDMGLLSQYTSSSLDFAGQLTEVKFPYLFKTTGEQALEAMGWFELGINAAVPIVNTKLQTLKVGVNYRLLFPKLYSKVYLSESFLTLDTLSNKLYLHGSTTLGYFASSPDIFDNADLSNFSGIRQFVGKPNGRAVDIGVSYHLKNAKGMPLIRAGLAFTDMGTATFAIDSNYNQEYRLRIPSTQRYDLREQELGSLDTYIEDLRARGLASDVAAVRGNSLRASLPRSYNAYLDLRILGPFYLHFYSQSAMQKPKRDSVLMPFVGIRAITPRFLIRNGLELNAPITFSKIQGTQLGLGAKLGMIHIGSNTLLSFVTGKPLKQIDLYVGLRMIAGSTKLQAQERAERKEESEEDIAPSDSDIASTSKRKNSVQPSPGPRKEQHRIKEKKKMGKIEDPYPTAAAQARDSADRSASRFVMLRKKRTARDKPNNDTPEQAQKPETSRLIPQRIEPPSLPQLPASQPSLNRFVRLNIHVVEASGVPLSGFQVELQPSRLDGTTGDKQFHSSFQASFQVLLERDKSYLVKVTKGNYEPAVFEISSGQLQGKNDMDQKITLQRK